MRNIFDQYGQPENKLTHALVTALSSDRKLVVPFLRWLKVKDIPSVGRIQIEQQRVPGSDDGEVDDEQAGLPDACFFDNDGWAALIESKIQSGISSAQLERHLRTAARYGFEGAQVFLFAVDKPKRLPKGVRFVPWKGVYGWFSKHRGESAWSRQFVEYVEIFESKMIAKEYDIRGTLTMFNGFHFNEKSPYTYHQGKRLLRLARQELQKDKKLMRGLGLSSTAKGRGAIKRGRNDGDSVWDYIPLKAAEKKTKLSFTAFPHATIVLKPDAVWAVLIVPNSMRGGFRRSFKDGGLEGFRKTLQKVEKRMRPVLRKVNGACPFALILQRHYKTQSSPSKIDGRMEFDLRTLIAGGKAHVKCQPMWVEAMYNVLTNKKSNIQFSIEVRLPYDAKAMRDEKSLDLIAESWLATKPVLDFVMGKK